MVDTIYNNINHLFNTNEWICLKTPTKLNYIHKIASLDEYNVYVSEANVSEATNVSEANVSEANVSEATNVSETNVSEATPTIYISIPLNDVSYKTTCYSLNDAINYLTLHRRSYNMV
jgi:hypothetical protein